MIILNIYAIGYLTTWTLLILWKAESTDPKWSNAKMRTINSLIWPLIWCWNVIRLVKSIGINKLLLLRIKRFFCRHRHNSCDNDTKFFSCDRCGKIHEFEFIDLFTKE